MVLATFQAIAEYAGTTSGISSVASNPLGAAVEWLSHAGVGDYVMLGAGVFVLIVILNKLLDAL